MPVFIDSETSIPEILAHRLLDAAARAQDGQHVQVHSQKAPSLRIAILPSTIPARVRESSVVSTRSSDAAAARERVSACGAGDTAPRCSVRRRLDPGLLPAVQHCEVEEIREKAVGFSKSIAAMTTLMCLRSLFLTVSALRLVHADQALLEESLAIDSNFSGNVEQPWSDMHIGESRYAEYDAERGLQDCGCSSSWLLHHFQIDSEIHGAAKEAWCMPADIDDIVSVA